jgi:hypothetical protein
MQKQGAVSTVRVHCCKRQKMWTFEIFDITKCWIQYTKKVRNFYGSEHFQPSEINIWLSIEVGTIQLTIANLISIICKGKIWKSHRWDGASNMMLIDFCVGKQTTKMKDSEVWVGKQRRIMNFSNLCWKTKKENSRTWSFGVGKKGRKQKGLIENFTLGNKEEKWGTE